MCSILILMLALGLANPAAAHKPYAYVCPLTANIVRESASTSRPTPEAHAAKRVPSEFSELPPL
jgi:hypothetical protein